MGQINAYVYRAALICEDCGRCIRADLLLTGKGPKDPEDESTFDSMDFPKGPYPDGGGESDSPQHCDMMDGCVNAEWCPAHGEAGGHKQGVFLENPLTRDGIAYVEECCLESLKDGRGCVALEVWAPFYNISLPESDELPKGE